MVQGEPKNLPTQAMIGQNKRRDLKIMWSSNGLITLLNCEIIKLWLFIGWLIESVLPVKSPLWLEVPVGILDTGGVNIAPGDAHIWDIERRNLFSFVQFAKRISQYIPMKSIEENTVLRNVISLGLLAPRVIGKVRNVLIFKKQGLKGLCSKRDSSPGTPDYQWKNNPISNMANLLHRSMLLLGVTKETQKLKGTGEALLLRSGWS